MSRKQIVIRSTLLRALAGGVLAASALQASAGLVTTRAALAADDAIDWGQLAGNQATEYAGVSSVTSTLGVIAAASNSAGSLFRFDENDGAFTGNFAIGDKLVSTFFTSGPIVVDFTTGLSKIGAQIQANNYGAFTGVITAYDSANSVLESWGFVGDSNGNQDNSAIFIGISRANADIDHVSFSIAGGADFAINQVALSRMTDQRVPEPASWGLAALSLVGLGLSRRRKG